jgi:hypothetical protein
MLASFFYQGDVPEPETLLDMARNALVAEGAGDLETEECRTMIDGLSLAWVAARRHESGEEDEVDGSATWEPTRLTRQDADVLYRRVALKVYVRRVKKTFPDYNCEDGDGVIWWPEGLTYERDGWPKEFVTKLALTLGEIEGDRTVHMFKAMQELDAEQKAAGAKS